MKGREHEPKNPHILHAIRDKHQPKCTAESNKHKGNRNGVKARKKQIQTEWSMHKGPRYHLLYPANTWEVGHRSRLSKGVV